MLAGTSHMDAANIDRQVYSASYPPPPVPTSAAGSPSIIMTTLTVVPLPPSAPAYGGGQVSFDAFWKTSTADTFRALHLVQSAVYQVAWPLLTQQ